MRERPAAARGHAPGLASSSGSCTGRSTRRRWRGLLPPGLDVDPFEGVAYVGIVPFTIPLTRAARFGAAASRPRSTRSTCARTSTAAAATPASGSSAWTPTSRLAVAGARVAYRLPYFAADIAMEVTTDAGTGAPGRQVPLRPSPIARGVPRALPAGRAGRAAAAPGSLEFFLAERYLLYAWSGGALRTARVHHAPYPLQPGAAGDVAQTLTYVAGPAAGASARATRRWSTTPEASTSRSSARGPSAPRLDKPRRGPIGQGPANSRE